jgi:hypothetical protein
MIRRAFRRAAAPLAWYYAMTLAVPFVNSGGHPSAAFLLHAIVVLLLPPALILLACGVRSPVRSLDRAAALSASARRCS